MPKNVSPFSGLKLSEQVRPAPSPLDQRLFASTSTPPRKTPADHELSELAYFKRSPTETSHTSPQSKTLEPRNQGSKEARKQGTLEATLEARNQGSLEAPRAERGSEATRSFDINERPYRQNTYAFTDAELNALEDMKIDIRRNLDLDVTKNDLIRCAVHELVEDFNQLGAGSSVLRRLRKKNLR